MGRYSSELIHGPRFWWTLRLCWCFGFAKKHFFVGVVIYAYDMLPSASRFIALWVDKAKDDVMVGKPNRCKFLWSQSDSTTGDFFLYWVRSNTQHTKHISIGIGERERGGCVAMVNLMMMMMTKMSNNTKCRMACFCEMLVLFYTNMRGMVGTFKWFWVGKQGVDLNY